MSPVQPCRELRCRHCRYGKFERCVEHRIRFSQGIWDDLARFEPDQIWSKGGVSISGKAAAGLPGLGKRK
jgi:hypothetical protein